jgi:ABC-2 type transport system permease protein
VISGFRWSFFGTADVGVWVSFVMIFVVLTICLAIVNTIFRTGYRLKS